MVRHANTAAEHPDNARILFSSLFFLTVPLLISTSRVISLVVFISIDLHSALVARYLLPARLTHCIIHGAVDLYMNVTHCPLVQVLFTPNVWSLLYPAAI